MKNFRARKMGLLLYPDDVTHQEAREKIKAYDYAEILHDKDADENGVILKPHYHVVISLKNAQWRSAISKELGIAENYIQQIRNEKSALEYLVHANEPDRHQYKIDEVTGSLRRKLIKSLAKEGFTEGEKVIEIINYIKDNRGISHTDLAIHCANSGYWDVYRRAGVIFSKILEENKVLKEGILVDVKTGEISYFESMEKKRGKKNV